MTCQLHLKILLLCFSIAFGSTHSFGTLGSVEQPLRDGSKTIDPVPTKIVRVPDAWVVIADYALLRRDFPQLRDANNFEINQWLLDQAGYIAETQALQSLVNEPIRTDSSNSKLAFRPKDYGRALVVPVADSGNRNTGHSGIIDIKGMGASVPLGGRSSNGDARNGLASLGEAIREYIMTKTIRSILANSPVYKPDGTPIRVADTYAVISNKFSIVWDDGNRTPSGLLLRQGHRRFEEGKYSLLPPEIAVNIERTLRLHGLSSAGDGFATDPITRINIQGTNNFDILDFGAIIAAREFHRPARHYHFPDILLDPDHLDYPQPQPHLRVPFERYGYSVTGVADTKMDNPWVWSHELAQNLEKGIAGPQDAQQHVINFLGSFNSCQGLREATNL